MFTTEEILIQQQINALQPQPPRIKHTAIICTRCWQVNENHYFYCTNCGAVLQASQQEVYKQKFQYNHYLLFKAQAAVTAARVVLYVMASFLSIGILFVFAEGNRKYLLVLMAVIFSTLFFSLALWSRKNPFSALLTAFIILVSFCAVNIFRSLTASFTTFSGFTGMLIYLALLVIVLRGVQGAYRINIINQQQMHFNA